MKSEAVRVALIFVVLVAATDLRAEDVSATTAELARLETLFDTTVRPTLIGACLSCHGGRETQSGFAVASRETLLQGGERGPAIVPGDAGASLLIQAIRRTHSEVQMPPETTLPQHVVEAFVQWIDGGAPWPSHQPSLSNERHWAFEPVSPTSPPADATGWSTHPIDAFIVVKHREKGLQPAEDADPVSLVRRLYFDLVGLPPTAEEAAAVVASAEDDLEGTLTREIDRLLASPRYGERWGRHWLDVARYADTAGDNADYPVPEARLYRDYVIDAFNADKPYDQFIAEQLAGDILAADGPRELYAERIAATGFLALSRRYATAPYEFWHLTLEDAIDTVGQAFMGLTLRCARCHDHKFDPVTSADYYALYGIFESTQFPWAGGEEFQSKKFPRQRFAPLAPPEEIVSQQSAFAQQLADLAARIAALDARLTNCQPDEKPAVEKQLAELKDEQLALERSSLPAGVAGAYAVGEGAAKDVAIHLQGDPAKPGSAAPRGAIAFLCREPLKIGERESGRRQLAEWLTTPHNPLTSRVIVNRLWMHHFGRGLVATPSNFGTRGAAPTHPELLDYLAAKFVRDGWSVKSMQRFMLTSRAWRLAARDLPDAAATDTGNEYYWRSNRRRLEAEAIRDAWMMISGRLDLSRPGEHPFPQIRDWHWTQHDPFKDVYPSNHRTVYLMTQRLQKHPFLALFDGPDTNASTEKRGSSTVPTQSLYLMNSPQLRDLARSFAEGLETIADEDERINAAHRICYARNARPNEVAKAKTYLAAYRAELSSPGDRDADRQAWTSYAAVLLASNEFLYVE